MVSSMISRLVILVFGTLYPAYASYKAVKTKNVREYVKWMMYWIVFALFTCAETFADIFLSFWLPFYYEMKIIFVLWLLSPATKGSSILYRKFVHPQLMRREQDIDEFIARAKDQGYATILQLGSKGLSYATNIVMQTALKVKYQGQETIISHLRKSYSMTDLAIQGRLNEDQTDDPYFGVPEHSRSPQRWLSENVLPEETESDEYMTESQQDELDKQSRRRAASGDRQSDTELRRTRSMPKKEASTSSGRLSKHASHTDVSAYATLPRTRTRGAKKKTTTKSN